MEKVLTTCPHCATGCQYYLVVKDNEIVDVEPANGPSNQNLLCVKGRFGSFNFVHSPERLKYPLIKNKETGESTASPKSFTFISATCLDNPPLLEANPDYVSTLAALPRITRERLLYGKQIAA